MHILDVVRRSTYVKLFRGEYCEPPPDLVVPASDGAGWEVNPEMQRSSHVTAAGKRIHAWDAGKHEGRATSHRMGERAAAWVIWLSFPLTRRAAFT